MPLKQSPALRSIPLWGSRGRSTSRRVLASQHIRRISAKRWQFGASEKGAIWCCPCSVLTRRATFSAKAVDFLFDPTVYIHMRQHLWWVMGREYATFVDVRARNMETLEDIERNSLDYYATTRSLYRQYRASEIRNGAVAPPAP